MAGRDIGYYTLPVIPSFRGIEGKVNADLNKAFGSQGTAGGQMFGRMFGKAAGDAIKSDRSIEQATERKSKAMDTLTIAMDRAASASGKIRTAEAQLTAARTSGNEARIVAAEERLANARRKTAAETLALTRANAGLESSSKKLEDALKDAGKGGAAGGSGGDSGGGGGGMMAGMLIGRGGMAGLNALAGTAGIAAGTAAKAGIAGVLTAAAAGLVVAPFAAGLKLFNWGAEVGLPLERNMNTLKGVTAATGAEMARAGQVARQLGSDTTLAGVTAGSAAEAMTELAKGGMTVEQAMAAARGTLQLATAGQIDAAKAAEIQSAAINVFGLRAEDAGKVADMLAASANASSASVQSMGLSLQQAGSVASGFGVSLDDTLTALTMMSRMGLNGADAGTAFKTSLQAITDQGKPAQAAIDQLGLKLYKTVEIGGKTDSVFVGMESMMKQVAEASKHMSQEQFQAATNVLFGSDAMRTSMIAARGGAAAWDDAARDVHRGGAAAEMAGAQMAGLPGIIEGVSNTVDSMKLQVYDAGNAIAVALGQQALGGLSGLSAEMQKHQPELIGFFTLLGTQAVSTAKAFLEMVSVVAGAMGDIVAIAGKTAGAVLKTGSAIARLTGDTAKADQWDREASAMFGWGDSLQAIAKGAADAMPRLDALQGKIQSAGDQANTAAQFTVAMGKAVLEVPDGKDIIITNNSPEVLASIDKTKFAIEHLPNGQFRIVPLTPEATAEMDAWRRQQGLLPIEPPVRPKADPAAIAAARAELERILGAPIQAPTVAPGGSALAPNVFLPPPPPPRAAGGLFAKQPDSAIIQPATRGLVMWAEPTTGGEAYIPLAGGRRSVDIWAETGRRLGVMPAGGNSGDPHVIAPFMPGQVDLPGGKWIPDETGRERYTVPAGNVTRPGGEFDVGPPAPGSPPLPGEWGPNTKWGPNGTPGEDPIWLTPFPYPGWPGDPFMPGDAHRQHRKHVRQFDTGAITGGTGGGDNVLTRLYQAAQGLNGQPYVWGSTDCSGAVSKLITQAMGGSGRMDTGSAPGWLQQHGFVIGPGPSGTFRVGWHNGGPGGGHMAATLPDGTNFESGGSHNSIMLGAGAAGADDKQFDQHAYLPLQGLFPDGRGGGAGGGGMGGIPAGATPGIGPGGQQGYYTAPDPKHIREANEKVSDADARVREADARVRELKGNASESEKIAAQNQADKAKREAADARADLESAQKGEFHEGRGDSSGGGAGGSGMGGNSLFGQLGGIAGQFMNDTFGFGSILPGLDKFPPLQFLFGMLGGLFGGGGGGSSGGGSGGGGGIGGMLGAMMGGGGAGMVGVGPAGIPGISSMLKDAGGPGDKTADIPGITGAAAPGSSIRTAGGLQQDNSVHVNVQGHSTNDVVKQVGRQIMWAPRVTTNTPVGWSA